MASSFFMLFDDIATLLDDVAVMTKVAAKKTSGVLGDDLALNANQVSGVSADRELPVVWAVAKGSMKNKAILVPAALLISAIAPWAITPMLMVGGLYLCFEGAEKIAHFLAHRKELENHEHDHVEAVADQNIDLVAFEKEKIKGAVQTDFILSAEIIVIALGSNPAATLTQRILVLVAVAIAMTVGVYGFVALIVKLDDYGMHLQAKASQIARSIGSAILWFAPWLMRALSYLGTAAMFLVGGSILLHGIPGLHHALQEYFPALPDLLFEAVTGLLAGVLCVLVYELYQRLKTPRQAKTQT